MVKYLNTVSVPLPMTSSPPPEQSGNNASDIHVEQEFSEFSYELKIPKDRVAVLIGQKGKIKRDFESQTKTKMKIDSQEGDVILTGKDSLALYSLREVIRAIGRGFNPEIASLLFKQDYVLEIIVLLLLILMDVQILIVLL